MDGAGRGGEGGGVATGRRKSAVDVETPFGGRPAGAAARLAWRLATARGLSSGWRRFWRKRLARRFPGPFDILAEGVSVRAYPTENHCDRTIVGRNRLPERPERALVAPLLEQGMTFVDIGANVGVYSLFVSRQTEGTARVVALEPHPRTFAKLDFNCRCNGFDGVRRLNAGVAAEAGVMTLHSDGGGNIGNASLLAAVGRGKEQVQVAVRPLAEIMREEGIERIDLLKIDVEGFEERALAPFFAVADASLWPRHLLLETVHAKLWERDLAADLIDAGYRVLAETEENLLLGLRTAGRFRRLQPVRPS